MQQNSIGVRIWMKLIFQLFPFHSISLKIRSSNQFIACKQASSPAFISPPIQKSSFFHLNFIQLFFIFFTFCCIFLVPHLLVCYFTIAYNGGGCGKCWRLEQRHRPPIRSWIGTIKLPNQPWNQHFLHPVLGAVFYFCSDLMKSTIDLESLEENSINSFPNLKWKNCWPS